MASGLTVGTFLAGCATPRGELFAAVDPPIVWPAPPETTRIRLLATLSGSKDLHAAVSAGEMFRTALRGPRPPIRFTGPHAVAVARDPAAPGRHLLAATDPAAAAVHVLDLDARTHALVSGWGASADQRLKTPIGVAWLGERLFVTDAERHEVIEFAADGAFRRRFGAEELTRPVGIVAVGAPDRLYVVDGGAHCVAVYEPSGRRMRTIGHNGVAPGEFNYPSHIAWDGGERLLVADAGNFRVQLLDLEGTCVRVLGRKGDGAGDLSLPKGVAFDRDGHLYVVDAHFENVQIFDQQGRLLLAFGEEGSEPGEFSLPAGLAIDVDDRIWVADSANHRLQVFTYVGNAG